MAARKQDFLSEGGEEVDRKVDRDEVRGKGRVLGERSGEKAGVRQEGGAEEESCEDVVAIIGRDIRGVVEVVGRSTEGMREKDRSMVLEVLVGVMGAVNELAAKWRRLEKRMMGMELEWMKEEGRVRERERKMELEREEWRRRLEEEEERVRELKERLKRQKEEERRMKEEEGEVSETRGRRSESSEKKKLLGGASEREGSDREVERISEGESGHESEREACVEEEGAWGGKEKGESSHVKVERMEGKVGENGEGVRIEGKVVLAGPEGWKMPVRDESEDGEGIQIRSREGKGAREMMRELVERLPGSEIGGSPLVVREAGVGDCP